MPFTNRNNNSSQRAGRGLGPCGAGMSRGRNAGMGQGTGMGRGMGAGRGQARGQNCGQGLGLRRRDGSCRAMQGQGMQNQNFSQDQYTGELERRIADLEAENQKLRTEANK